MKDRQQLYAVLRLFQMIAAHQSREKAIKHCIAKVSDSVEDIRSRKDKDEGNVSLHIALRAEQFKVQSL